MEKSTKEKNYHNMQTKLIRFSLLALSLLLIVLGVMRGEARTVLQKAVLICLECIGIG